MSTHDVERPGLRERKKARTRASIREHALRLFQEHGYAATRVEQIAEAAEVSPATFYRYFPTKEDVVLQDDLDVLTLDALEAQPPGLSPLAAVRAAVAAARAGFTEEERERFRQTTELTMAVPEIRARALDEFARTIDVSAAVLARRSGREPDDIAVRALAGAVFGVIMAITLPALERGQIDLDAIFVSIDAGLAQLEAGFRPDQGAARQSPASPHVARAELHADPWPGRPGRLRHRVFPGALAAAAHHQQVAVADLVPQRRAATPGPEQQGPRRTQGQDGHHGVLLRTPADPVTVPGDTVPAVPVQAQARRAERFPQLFPVVPVQRGPRLRQHRVGQGRILAVEAEQPGHLNHPVVHPPPLLAPRHGVAQPFEQDVGARHPAGPDVHPRAAIEDGPVHRRAEQPRSRLVAQVEQGSLQSSLHAPRIRQIKYVFDLVIRPAAGRVNRSPPVDGA